MTDTTPAQATPDVKQANNAPQENESAAPGTFAPVCKSLYVADLAPNVTESNLLEVFTRVGQNAIQSIRVCRDSSTGTSLGYAYVNFHRPEDCEKALDVLNFEEINGRPCRISKSNRDPRVRRSGVGNLFVKNIAKDIDHAGLHDVFSTFGEIISCKVATDRITGESKGYGFVHFSNPEDAEKAIENLNGKCLNDKQVYVGKFIPRQARQPSGTGSGKTFTNIFLKNLNKNLTQEKFIEVLEKATGDLGKITSPKLMVVTKEDGSEVSQGFGFVNFENHEVAAAALERFKDTAKIAELAPELTAEGETLYSNVAMSKTERKQMMESQDKNLYVKNIADSITDEKFKELFEEKNFGNITSAVIMKDDAGTRKGFGFVCYETKEAASAAKQGMNGQLVAGKPLYVAIAQPKDQRRRQLANQFNRNPMGHPGVPPVGYPGVPHGFFVGGMPAARFQQPRNPSFQQRGRVPGFAAGGRGAPRPYPGNMPPQQPQQTDFLSDFFKTLPETDASQRLGDMLYGMLVGEDKVSEFDAKTIVGRFLQEAQTRPIQLTVEQVQFLHVNPGARRAMIQKYTAPADQQQA